MKRQRELATWVGAILGSLCALLFAVAQSHAAENRGQFTQEFHQTYALAAGGRVALANINGSVHISGWDRNEVKADAVKYARSKDRLDEAKIVVDASTDSVSIRSHPAKSRNGRQSRRLKSMVPKSSMPSSSKKD